LCLIAEHRPDFKQLVFTAIDALKGRGNELARFDTSPNDYYEYMWDLSPDGTQIAIVQYSGALIAGDYTVRISAKGFSTVMSRIAVLIGNTASGDVRLPLGIGAEVIDVTSSGLKVNTQQAMVQGVLNSLQVESLPVNGRNFLDLAQLEPGVQIQDGQNFDLTKAGYSSISFGGRYGRTARIEVDGVDVSDETVGTTTTDIPSSAIQEFQLGQSSLDEETIDRTRRGAQTDALCTTRIACTNSFADAASST